jgi:hypothetical protein
MSTKLYNGLKAEVSNLAEFSSFKNDLQKIVEKFYIGKYEEFVMEVYKDYLKKVLKQKHDNEAFSETISDYLCLFTDEERQAMKSFDKDFKRNISFSEKILGELDIDSGLYYKALVLMAVSETVSLIVAKHSNKTLFISKDKNEIDDLETIIFVYPMEDKCLIYPIDSSYKTKSSSFEIRDELLKLNYIKDYHYQNNTDMPKDVSIEEWEQRIEDWDKVLDVENNPLGYLSSGMKVEASNFNSLPVKGLLFSNDIKKDVINFIMRVDFDKLIQSIKDDIIFHKEFIGIKRSDCKVSSVMRSFSTFSNSKSSYRKKYSFLNDRLKDLI